MNPAGVQLLGTEGALYMQVIESLCPEPDVADDGAGACAHAGALRLGDLADARADVDVRAVNKRELSAASVAGRLRPPGHQSTCPDDSQRSEGGKSQAVVCAGLGQDPRTGRGETRRLRGIRRALWGRNAPG